ncbi:MAG TPA: FtsX-like permease family protein [Bryobacteraceae bacterium]|nr:FtsX-like permease family protein [Bryobacteraceae bacterium]
MTKFLLLAFRNVFRNRRRTLMTLIVVAGGVAALLLSGGFFAFLFRNLRENTIRNGLGHLQIYNASYFARDEKHVLDNGLDDVRRLQSSVQGAAHVRGTAARVEFNGLVSNGDKSSPFLATAVDPEAEQRMGFELRITAGRDLKSEPPGASTNQALIAQGLAHTMHVGPGDGLTLLAVTADGALNGIDVNIVGLYTTGIEEQDQRQLRLTLQDAQRLLQSNRVTKLVVGLDATDHTDAVYSALLDKFKSEKRDIAIRKWIDLATFYNQVHTLFSGIFAFTGVLVFFMVVMSSANTLMMAMFERIREIGTMLAMGTPRAWITGLFVMEGVVTGALGAGLGVVLGGVAGALFNSANVKLPPPPTSNTPLLFHVLQVPALTVGASLLVIATLALASITPAMRAARLRIVESLAHI